MLARQKAIVFCCSFSLMSGVASVRASSMTCPLLEVRSILSSEDSEEEALRAAGPNREAPPSLTSLAARPDAASQEEVTLIALGPVLDSLDSREIKTDLVCTADGATIAATITRYSGGVKKNVLWRPRIRIVVALRRSEAQFRATWKMRRTDGTELDHVGVDQKYPVTVMTTIRSQ
jgi:hypothetical protein